MNWETFFEDAENVTAEETRRFIESGEPDRYQLVDVRQPKEYEQAHIPGAILLPLAELSKRFKELNPDKPTIVYCRSGVRSKAACQVLSHTGIKHVFNMTGGIITWQGAQAEGDVEDGLEFFANGNFPTTFELAYQMEDGLRRFYLALSE
ncbi:MAG: rhodanese-like domain-containing protein, partial [Desulfofustis sp.]|nr:rhodanese-like domain-containing protein [Desulfofustis sp.]